MKLKLVSIMLLLASAGLPVGAEAAQYVIEIKDMKFGAAPAHLKVGDTIEWKNSDFLQHTATARTNAFDVKLPPNASATVALKQAGAIGVYCRYHPTMTLVLKVAKGT